jgi:hypothetical protein
MLNEPVHDEPAHTQSRVQIDRSDRELCLEAIATIQTAIEDLRRAVGSNTLRILDCITVTRELLR